MSTLHCSEVSWLSFPLENEIWDLWESLSIDRTRVTQCLLLDNCLLRDEHQTLFSRREICHYKRIPPPPLNLRTPERRSGGVSAIFSPSSLEEVSVLLPFWSSEDAELPESLKSTFISSSDPFSLCNLYRSKYSCALLANLARSLLLIVNPCNNRVIILVLEDCALRTAAQLLGTRGLHYLSIASRVNVFVCCIEDQFTH